MIIRIFYFFFCDNSIDTNANNSSVEFDQSFVDDNAQSISNTSISSHGFYAVGLNVSDIIGNWDFLALFSVKNSNSKDYEDALATENYKLFYTDNLSSDITENSTHRQTIDSVYLLFDTVSKTDLTALSSNFPVYFVSLVSRQTRKDNLLLENEGVNTPRPACQQTLSSWHILDNVRSS